MATIDELARKKAIDQIPAGAARPMDISAVDQIPTGGLTAPAYDDSGSTELGRNVFNTINALAGVAPVVTGANALLNASRIGSLAQAAPTAINTAIPNAAAQPIAPVQKLAPPIVTPGVSPTGGITGQTPPAVNALAANSIQAQAKQAATAPVAPPTGAIQKLGIRRQPLNVPLQQPQAAQQPVQQGIPAVGQNLPETPIAYVGYGGGNSTQVAYKDGRTAEIMQGQAMPDDVKAFNLISQQAGQQGGNVNVMRGVPKTYNRDGSVSNAGGVQQTLALPAKPGEAFMREVPVELGGNIAAIGKYQAAQSQGAINNVDPTTAANAQRMAELGLTTGSNERIAQGNNATSTKNAGISAGPGYAGVNQRASEAAAELGFKREQTTKPVSVGGGQEPIYDNGMFVGMRTVPARLFDPKSQKWIEQPTAIAATPATAPPPQAAAMLKSNPKLAADFDKKYGAGASAQILGK